MTTTTIDGLIYAQPLFLSGVTMASTSCTGSKNIVIVASENNSVYAFAVDNSTPGSFSMTSCWTKSFNGTNEYSIPFTALPTDINSIPCNNVVPESGITGTPVIDTSMNPPILYVVTGHQTATSSYTYRLHALRVDNGNELGSGIDLVTAITGFSGGSSFTATGQNQRPGLALFRPSGANPRIYVGFSSFCDLKPSGGTYSGYVAEFLFSASSKTFTINGLFNSQTGSGASGGGIWMAGGAPALDSNGNVYVSVGNGDFDGASNSGRPKDFGESVVKLVHTTSSGLVAVDYYAPNDFSVLNLGQSTGQTVCLENSSGTCPTGHSINLPTPGDYDLGSGGVTLLNPVNITTSLCPSNQELVAAGKEGTVYGVCYSTSSSSSAQSTMGGLDSCGYSYTTSSSCWTNLATTYTNTACTQGSTLPTAGQTAQCFPGVDITNTVSGSPGSRGTAAFWAGNSSNTENWLYIGGSGDALKAYLLQPNSSLFNTNWAADNNPRTFPYPGTTPSVSWDNNNPNTGLVFAIDNGGYGHWDNGTTTHAATAAVLAVYAAVPISNNTVLNELWASSVSGSHTGPGAVKFQVPTVANGMVFVAGGNNNPYYEPGKYGATNVNCSPAAAGGTTPTCTGLLSVYGKLR